MYRSHIENPRVDGSIPPLATITRVKVVGAGAT